MSNYKMNIDFFGNKVLAETDGSLVCLNDLFTAGTAWRTQRGKPALQLQSFLNSVSLREYVEAASKEWGLPPDKFVVKVGKGKYTRTMVHVSVAILAAEFISPEFHARVHKEFIEGKILEFRNFGGSEFISMNIAIDQFLPERDGKDNKGVIIQCAKTLRTKILGAEATTESWNTATSGQTHLRYQMEDKIVSFLKLGLIKNYTHLKETIDRM